MKKLLLLCTLSFTIFSCGAYVNKKANPYYFGLKTLDNTQYKNVNHKNVKIYDYTDANTEYFLKRGYIIKAKSSFTDIFVHSSWAQLAASKLGSDVVLCKSNYVGTVSGKRLIPWFVPGETYTVTSSTSGNLSTNSSTNSYAVGNNGYAYGNSTSNGSGTYNSTTVTTVQAPDKYQIYSVPYSNDYYDQYALFMVKKYYWLSDNAYYDGSYYNGTDKNSSKIGTIKSNQFFEILSETKKHYKVRYGTVEGYLQKTDWNIIN